MDTTPVKTQLQRTKPADRCAGLVRIPFLTMDRLDRLCPPTRDDLRHRRRSFAFHEAGHAFAASWFGFRPKPTAAELFTQGGLTYIDGEALPFDESSVARSRIEEAVVFLLAGRAAEMKLWKQYSDGWRPGETDRDEAKGLIEIMIPPTGDLDIAWVDHPRDDRERKAYFTVLEYRAQRLVSKPTQWP